MTDAEFTKLIEALHLLRSGRVNDCREELEELRAAAADNRPNLLTLRGAERGTNRKLDLIQGSPR